MHVDVVAFPARHSRALVLPPHLRPAAFAIIILPGDGGTIGSPMTTET